MTAKEHILSEIRRMAGDNGGVPLGQRRFLSETGIKVNDWRGKFWARWNDALTEAGFPPNQLNAKRTDEDLLGNLAGLIRELGRFPTHSDLRLKTSNEPGFPGFKTFRRFGNMRDLATKLEEFSRGIGEDDIAELCSQYARTKDGVQAATAGDVTTLGEDGFVYLVKSGRYYKVGMTKDLGRRGYDLRIQLPEAPNLIHSIRTDDPRGIEAYWHSRFAERRKNGEWFDLTARDVAVFKRRKSFM